ncbi:MAG: hypothetical protein A3F40_03155 [Chlamydiae bacterium RIFCSPHIGHO2_12_FULL_27_8]|nr:MAG: hypothetical protein A3F40_03155 [Chlamydiae bacterium RIFCSPHIGHO2_12_FULL_27_8]OGN64772.1 MAG: hypothetical protein A2888_01230 [Chlamydiae bacterium RIFCSPLOWO2_01_FULL_28_7]
MLKRIYEEIIKEHFKENRQMLFISGPRQVGKTTTSLFFKKNSSPIYYFNWDNFEQKELILKGPSEIARIAELSNIKKHKPYIIFDEIHKFSKWKTFVKGLYDTYPNLANIIVTGSARLDFFKKSGDSLMGRYFQFRLHPLSVAELLTPKIIKTEIRKDPKKISDKSFNTLFNYGGYPDPFIKANPQFFNKWQKLRSHLLFRDDLRDLSKIQEVDQMEVLAEMITRNVGNFISYDSYAKNIRISANTVRTWLKTLEALYYCFKIKPYSKNIKKSLLKEPKYYLWDWSLCSNEGAKAENFIASHLLKAVQFWTDYGFGNFELTYLRDKEKREVDFLILKNQKPYMLIEVKKSDQNFSSNLDYFQKQLNAEYVFQVVLDAPYIDESCFKKPNIKKIVPAKTFLSQLI